MDFGGFHFSAEGFHFFFRKKLTFGKRISCGNRKNDDTRAIVTTMILACGERTNDDTCGDQP
jgi:hypothetical protein